MHWMLFRRRHRVGEADSLVRVQCTHRDPSLMSKTTYSLISECPAAPCGTDHVTGSRSVQVSKQHLP